MTMQQDEAAIRERIGRVVEGIRAKDLDALGRLYAEDVVSFDIEPPLQHVGVDAKLKNWANVFASFAEPDYEIRDLQVAVGGSAAFGHGFGRLSGTLANGAAVPGMWVRVTYCFTQIDGDWLIAHDQVSVPFDIAAGKGVTDLQP